ncbi:MAG: EAL domain-containing protein [Clostridiales bacterium]|jgi:diguanylate cyclase (GGDEF)-like protein|nr:EAL domain-containing protein [Clostridiales bacterium]
MRITVQIILVIIVIVLGVCIHFAGKSDKPIARSVRLLIMSLIPAIVGNIIIIGATEKGVAEIGMYIYFIGMDIIMAFLLKFAIDYCYYSWNNKLVISAVYSLFTVDVIQLLLNPVFGHAFGARQVSEDGEPYFQVVPYMGQHFHRVIAYGFLFAVLILFTIKALRSSRLYTERYATMLASMIFTSIWESFYILSGTPVDTSMIGFGIFGVLVFYFALYHKPVYLLSGMLESIASGLPEALFFFNEEGQCIWANELGHKLLGIKEEHLENVSSELRAMFPELSEEDEEWIGDHVSTRGSERTYYHIEKHRAVDKSGRRRVAGSFISVRDNTEIQNRLERERYNATHDRLTGLYNKEHLFEEIPKMIARHPDTEYQAVFVDINEFKLVNDVFGKEFGDHVLRQVADWIRTDMRERSVYGRIGGDTFGVCMPVEEFDPDALNEQISSYIVREGDKEHRPLIHLGVYKIDDPDIDASIMFDRARMALSKIKRIYSHIAYYNDELREEILWNQQISAQITDAIADGQIRPYLQPIVNAEGELVGAEALARWIHPDKGFLPPSEFIPHFEHNGKIAEVDRFMWNKAGEILASWKSVRPDMFISVNISPVDFYFLDIPRELNAVVSRYDIDPSRLRVEITEAVVTSNIEERIDVINRLRSDGFIVEMDDFGSGYSSLNMLKELPVDLIKLDMIFLRSSHDSEKAKKIVDGVIRLIDSLGIDSLTEGVETERQFKTLVGYGCKLFQGYYFAKPMPLDKFEEFCDNAAMVTAG